jgi:hypothetical protein
VSSLSPDGRSLADSTGALDAEKLKYPHRCNPVTLMGLGAGALAGCAAIGGDYLKVKSGA